MLRKLLTASLLAAGSTLVIGHAAETGANSTAGCQPPVCPACPKGTVWEPKLRKCVSIKRADPVKVTPDPEAVRPPHPHDPLPPGPQAQPVELKNPHKPGLPPPRPVDCRDVKPYPTC